MTRIRRPLALWNEAITPSLDLAFRICDVFGLPVEAVFSRTAFTSLSAEFYGRRTRTEGSDSHA